MDQANTTVSVTDVFDLSSFELEETAVLTVQNAKGDDDLLYNGNPVRITLYGSGSEQFVNASFKAENAATKRFKESMRGREVKNEAQIASKELAEKLRACTAGIENFPISGGALELYSNPKLGYIKKQVIKFLDEDANFMKASTKN